MRIRLGSWLPALVLCVAVVAEGKGQAGPSAAPGADRTRLEFAVATVKPSESRGWRMEFTPDGFVARGATLTLLVQEAFGAYSGGYVTGGPGWAEYSHGDRFDVQARLDPAEIPHFRELSLAQRRAMLRDLLRKRFGLVAHTETKEVKGYELRVAKGGPKADALKLVKDPERDGSLGEAMCSISGGGPYRGDVQAKQCSMRNLSEVLCGSIAPKIEDKTGIEGRFDFELHWAPEHQTAASVANGEAAEGGPPLLLAVRQQLGLELAPAQVGVEVVVIDKAERPGEN